MSPLLPETLPATMLLDALRWLGTLGVFGWLGAGVLLVWLNTRVGLPRARRDLQWRGLGLLLLGCAAVLSLGQGLVALWPWPPQAALLCAVLAPLLAGWLLAQGRWGWALLAGLSLPFFVLIALTALFGLWLDLPLVGGVLLALAALASAVGLLMSWRSPRPAASPWAAQFPFGRGAAGRFRRGPAPDDQVVDVEARDVDEPPPPALPR